jgi:DNA-nicking Smr family endonuclease
MGSRSPRQIGLPSGSYQAFAPDALTPEQQQAKFRVQSRLMIKDPALNLSSGDLQTAASVDRSPQTNNEAVVNLLALIYQAMQNNRSVTIPHIAG